MRNTSCMETVGRRSTHRLDRITCRVGATCPLAQRTLQGGLSTCHVKRLVRARLPASRVENRLNRQNMFEQNNVKKNLCVHYQTSYLWIEKTSSSRGWGGGGGLTYMCRPKKYGLWAFLIWKRGNTLPILVWNRVWFLRELRECMNVP